LLHGSEESAGEGDVLAAAWFDHELAERHYIHEHSIRTSYGDVLSFFGGKDERCSLRSTNTRSNKHLAAPMTDEVGNPNVFAG